jgi:subtilisin-like proprotein convertase family protein
VEKRPSNNQTIQQSVNVPELITLNMRIIPLIIAVFTLISIENLPAQNCGCADEGNCPFPFSANSNTQVCYEITDAFNNNLASPTQGVCGVSVRFRHGRVGSMNLTLTSPNGTQVQLIGTAGNCNTWTPIATWDILFLPCGETCVPDTVNNCPYPCVFDGCPTNCPWANANYSGSYHPFSGCLENFNTGPANGQWCLEIDNNAQFNGGSILDFEIILCDQSGILCCDADAGNLNFEPDVDACVGDSSLLLDPNPIYGAIVPDTAEYGYTYAIFEQNTLLAYDSMPNLMPYMPGTYQVCGLSYLYADTASMPNAGTTWTPQSLNDTLNSANPPFCGNIATNCILVQIASPPLPTNLTDTICQGDTLFVGSEIYTEPGVYSDTLNSFFGCDSIVNLALTVLPLDTTFLVETLCPGETFTVGNSTYSATGSYANFFQNSNGCDSTVFLDLTVLPLADTLLTDTICQGDSVVINGKVYSASGIFMDTLTSFFNCDSVITLDLTVVNVSVSILPPDTLDCQQQTVTLTASATTSLGTISYEWSLLGGTLPGTNTAPSLTVSDTGSYVVTVAAEGCTAADTVAVFQNASLPTAVAFAVTTDTLTCGVTSVQLDGSTSTGAGTLSWQWTAQGGSPISNPTGQVITVSSPDIYELVVTDVNNNCSDTTEVTVFQNIIPPVANAGPDTMLSCSALSINLDGSASMPAGNISYAWSAVAGGNILPPANIPNPAVNATGTYQLLVTNLENACQDSGLVVVNVDTLAPNAIISLPDGDSLNCLLTSLTLDGSASTGIQNSVFQWVGNISTGQGTPSVTVTEPGNFTLILTDTQNGCTDSATVTIGIFR